MVRKFEPRNNKLELEILGERFTIDVFDPTLLKRVEMHRKNLNEKADELKSFDDDSTFEELQEALEKAISLCADAIDNLLGENASKRIFKDEAITFLDAVDVSKFLFEEIDDYMQNDIVSKYSTNRAQRRAKK